MPGCRLQRERVFEFVGDLAQFAIAASRCVALERVHSAPDATDDFVVARLLLELQRFVVQGLEQFLRALEKQLAEFGHALVGLAHDLTSMRWYAVPLLRCTIWNFSVSPSRLSAWPTNRYPSEFRQR
jgi:hypothetical protein